MASSKLRRLAALIAAAYPMLSLAAPPADADPCAKIAGLEFVLPTDALACYKIFPFNETLRDNVMTNAARVLDFYTYEKYYLNSPPPFQESTVDIRATLAKISATKFATDYDFNKALYDFTTQMNDGHTRYFPLCYQAFLNILPAPVVSLEENGLQNLFVAPHSVEFISQLGTNFTSYYDKINFDWKRLAGAKIVQIEGQDPYNYVDFIARTVSGNYLDHGVRVNSVFTSYQITDDLKLGQRLGDLAGQVDVTRTSLTMKLITINSTKVETVQIPYLATFMGNSFTDKASFWENNRVAQNNTNGGDFRDPASDSASLAAVYRQPKAYIVDKLKARPIGLSEQSHPTAIPVNGTTDAIKSFILPDGKTGVMFVGTFFVGLGDFIPFQDTIVSVINDFKAAGVQQVIIDLTGNGGGFVCLAHFLHQYLAGTQITNGGFQTTMRASPLAQKIVPAVLELEVNNPDLVGLLQYSPSHYSFLNDTPLPNFDYMNPTIPFSINGKSDPTSQRLHDNCTAFFADPIPKTPAFDLSKIAIVSNGNCASACALFSTVMFERHQTKVAVFGGKPGENVEYKGMAGNEVLDWATLDTEIKSVGLKDDPLAPPDLLVNADFRINWRTAWNFLDENRPIAYVSELPLLRFPYTKETYNNPQNLWISAATKLFG